MPQFTPLPIVYHLPAVIHPATYRVSPACSKDGAGQQCCYDRDGYLMMSADQMWGGNPHRAHNLGKTPFDEANKVTNRYMLGTAALHRNMCACIFKICKL